MSLADDPEESVDRVWVSEASFKEWLALAVVHGLVAAVCMFALGWAFFPRDLVIHVAFAEPNRAFKESYYRDVGWCGGMAFLFGAAVGQLKVGGRFRGTVIGFMLGVLVGVIVADLSPNPSGAVPALMFGGGLSGGFAGCFLFPLRRTGRNVEVRPPGPDRPPLWDREMDG